MLDAQKVVFRQETVVEYQLRGVAGAEAHFVELAADRKSRCVLLHDEHADSVRAFACRIGAGRHKIDVGIHAIGDPEFRAVDHPSAIDAGRLRLYGANVGGGIDLADGDGRKNVAADDAGHVAAQLRLGSRVDKMGRGHQRMHGRDAHDTGIRAAPQFFGKHEPAEYIHAAAAILFGKADAEEAEIAHHLEEAARNVPFLLPGIPIGLDLLLDKSPDLATQLLMLFQKHCH